MNLFTGESADAFFGGEVPAAVHALLHQAAASAPAVRGTLLWTAQALAPQCLAIYYTLYKHHAGQRELDLAERAALRGLAEAAQQAGLPAGLPQLWPADAALPAATVWASGPGRFWLFTLKALAFISLRSGRPEVAQACLAQIERLAPGARLGDEVTRGLLDAARSASPGGV